MKGSNQFPALHPIVSGQQAESIAGQATTLNIAISRERGKIKMDLFGADKHDFRVRRQENGGGLI